VNYSISCPARFATQPTPGRKSLGKFVAATAAALGKPLFGWQRFLVDVAYEIDPVTGLFAYDDVTIVVPRQQGKTELILPVMTHRSVSFPVPQRILYTAQTAAEARKKWEDIHVARLNESEYKPMFTVRLRLNAEAIAWRNGSFWMPGSTTGKTGGTGDTLDLGVIDEMWSRPDNRTELGMRPAMMTRVNRQLWRLSMVPGLSRLKGHDPRYIRDQMIKGRERVAAGVNTGQAYFEWSADPSDDPGDPRTWRSCMPGLKIHGGLIPESTIASDYQTMELVDFCAEYLGWPVDLSTPAWAVIGKGTWGALWDDESQPAGSIALGIDVDPDRLHAGISMVGRRSDGDWHMELIEPGSEIAQGTTGMDWLEGRVLDLHEKHNPVAVVIDQRSPAASLIKSLVNRGIEVVTLNIQEYAAACGTFFDGTGQNAGEEVGQRIRHIDNYELTRAVSFARTTVSPSSGSFSWLRVGSTDITPLVSATLALHGYELKKPDDYELDDSIPDDYNQCRYCYACEIDGYLQHYPTCERPK